jgi:hypothetical protein
LGVVLEVQGYAKKQPKAPGLLQREDSHLVDDIGGPKMISEGGQGKPGARSLRHPERVCVLFFNRTNSSDILFMLLFEMMFILYWYFMFLSFSPLRACMHIPAFSAENMMCF